LTWKNINEEEGENVMGAGWDQTATASSPLRKPPS